MTLSELIEQSLTRQPAVSDSELTQFEATIGSTLPDDYRGFLKLANGISIADDTIEIPDADYSIQGFGGTSELLENRQTYQIDEKRIPREVLWIDSDAFGRALCLGISGPYRGKIYLWDPEFEPGSKWDGKVDTAEHIDLIANTFSELVGRLRKLEKPKRSGCLAVFALLILFSLTIFVTTILSD